MAWSHLVAAIAFELVGTLALRAAATGARAWYVLTLATYALSFGFLARTRRRHAARHGL